MPRKGHSPEQVLNKLRQVEVAVAGGKSVGRAVREIGVTDHTYYRWRREYGGLNLDQARRLKKLEQENARLKRTIADLALDKQILKEAAEGNFQALHVAESVLITFGRYAANVGLVIVSGKRFWQRAPVPLLPTPKFDYRPGNYRPRPLPWRAAFRVAVAVALGIGFFGSLQMLTGQSELVEQAEYRQGIIERQVDLRSLRLEDIREERALLNAAQLRTERLIAASELIQDRAAGFAETMSTIAAATPPDVRVTTVDDDARVLAVDAEAAEYSTLLGFIGVLNEVPQFAHIQILNLSKVTDADTGTNAEPAMQFGESAVVETGVKMSIEITRIVLIPDENEILRGEELAVAGNQDSAVGPR